MALSKPITQLLTVASLAANTESAQGSALQLDVEVLVALTVKLTYAAGAVEGVELLIYSSPDNVSYDTIPFKSYLVPVIAGATRQITVEFVPSPAYIKVAAKNRDLAQAVTTLTVTAAALSVT